MDTTQLLKGVLDVAVLAVITHEDGYGYDVVRRLRTAGLTDVGDASVYGTLKRLYSAGALTSYVMPSDDGPHRKYYGINALGRSMLAEQSEAWRMFSGTMTKLLDPTPVEAVDKQSARPRQLRAARESTGGGQLENVGGGRTADRAMWKIGDTL